MTDDPVINWRAVYLKLAGLSLLAAIALIVLGYWLYKPVDCGWHGCLWLWDGGQELSLPFGNMDYHFAPSGDILLWGVLGLIFAVWLMRRIARLIKFD